jgi:hypothetical protein
MYVRNHKCDGQCSNEHTYNFISHLGEVTLGIGVKPSSFLGSMFKHIKCHPNMLGNFFECFTRTRKSMCNLSLM